MSKKRSSHSQFGPGPFSNAGERFPPLALDQWQADTDTPFNGLNSRSSDTPAFKKRRQSQHVPQSKQDIEVFDPSIYCESQTNLAPTNPLNIRCHTTPEQQYVASSPYTTSSNTSHSPATSMSDIFVTHTPNTSIGMSRETSLYEHIDMLRLRSQTSDDMRDSHSFDTQSASNGCQSSDLSPFNPSLSVMHAGGVADDASSSVSNLATCYTSPSTVVHDNAMTRSLSSDSVESSKSRSSRRSLQEVNQSARRIKPKEDSATTMSRQSSSTSCAGTDMTRVRSADGSKVGIPKNNSYVRPQHPKVFCDQCNIKPEGFRGPHELRRHVDNKHSTERTVWVCKDRSPDQTFLSNCKACNEGKKYGAYYNAAAHLRRIHFHAKEKKKGKGTSKEKPRGGDGGGDDPPMDVIKLWIEDLKETVSQNEEPIKDDDEEDNGILNYMSEGVPNICYTNTYCQPEALTSTDTSKLQQLCFSTPDTSHTLSDVAYSPSFNNNTPFDISAYDAPAPPMFTSSDPIVNFNANANAAIATSVTTELHTNDTINLAMFNPNLFGSLDQFDFNDPPSYPFA